MNDKSESSSFEDLAGAVELQNPVGDEASQWQDVLGSGHLLRKVRYIFFYRRFLCVPSRVCGKKGRFRDKFPGSGRIFFASDLSGFLFEFFFSMDFVSHVHNVWKCFEKNVRRCNIVRPKVLLKLSTLRIFTWSKY